jgi:hypothetical protein
LYCNSELLPGWVWRRDLIPLTAAESRRLFNLHVPVTHPVGFRLH